MSEADVHEGGGCPPSTLVVLAGSLSNTTSTPLRRAIKAYRRLSLTGGATVRQRPALPKRAKHLSASELARLATRHEQGATVYDLADEFEINRKTVAIRLKASGVSMRRQPPSPSVVDELVRLYESGLSLQKAGDQFGVSAGYVLHELRRRGVPTRPAHPHAEAYTLANLKNQVAIAKTIDHSPSEINRDA